MLVSKQHSLGGNGGGAVRGAATRCVTQLVQSRLP